jgi:hypothetical protein
VVISDDGRYNSGTQDRLDIGRYAFSIIRGKTRNKSYKNKENACSIITTSCVNIGFRLWHFKEKNKTVCTEN